MWRCPHLSFVLLTGEGAMSSMSSERGGKERGRGRRGRGRMRGRGERRVGEGEGEGEGEEGERKSQRENYINIVIYHYVTTYITTTITRHCWKCLHKSCLLTS